MRKFHVEIFRYVKATGNVIVEAESMEDALRILRDDADGEASLFRQATYVDFKDWMQSAVGELVDVEEGLMLPPILLTFPGSETVISEEQLENFLNDLPCFTEDVYSDETHH